MRYAGIVRTGWVLLLLLGCGDNLPSEALFASGSRLRAVAESGGSNSQVLAWFDDTELGIECTFATDLSARWRCMPRTVVTLAGYADSACTQPVYRCPSCTGGETLVRRFDPGCNEQTPYVEDLASADLTVPIVGRPVSIALDVSASAPPRFDRVGDTCGVLPNAVGSFVVGDVADQSKFAEATLHDRPVDDEVGARTLIGVDGSLQRYAAYMIADGRICRFDRRAERSCIPGTQPSQYLLPFAAFYTASVDGKCSGATVYASSADPTCEGVSHALTSDGVISVESHIDPVYEAYFGSTSCTVTTRDLAFWRPTTAPVSLPLVDELAVGSGAARPVFYAEKGTPLQFTTRWTDATNMPCTPRETAAGRRCLPPTVSLYPDYRIFDDAACTIEIVVTDPASGGTPTDVRYAVAWRGVTTSSELTKHSIVERIHPLTTDVPTYRRVYILSAPDRCNELPNSPSYRRAYLGAAIELSQFPAITFER